MTSEHRNNFNLIRLLAASQVMLVHAQVHLGLTLSQTLIPFVDSFPGVPIFFVVSGFLVTRSFIEGDGGVAGYFIRRALRIYPGLWTHFLVIFAALSITGAFTLATLFSFTFWQWVGASFVFGSDFWGNLWANAYPFESTGFYKGFPSGVLWTITVELGFYLLVPIIFMLPIRRYRLTAPAILIFGAASLYFSQVLDQAIIAHPGYNTTAELQSSPLPYLWVFLIGATASIYWHRVKMLFIGRFAIWAIAYFVLTELDRHFFLKQTIDLNHFVGLAVPRMFVLAGVVVSFAYTLPVLGRWVKHDISYGSYLYHMPLIMTLIGLGYMHSRWLWLVVYVGTFAIASLSWFIVERPALRAKRFSAFAEAWILKFGRKLLGFEQRKAVN